VIQNQNNDQNFRRKQEGPRRVRNGVRLRTREEDPQFNWPAAPWLATIMGDTLETTRKQGIEFARKGQTVSIDIEPSRITAAVQDEAPRPHIISIDVAPIGRDDWDRIITTIAREARYAAKFVTGDITAEVAAPFDQLGLALLPAPNDVSITCDCGKDRCHHVATTAYLLAERMTTEPLLLLTLRGLYGPLFLERLQEARLLVTSGVSRAHPIPTAASVARDLVKPEEAMEDYWSTRGALAAFERSSRLHHAPHALLRRLGSTPLVGKFPLVGLLASIYDSVASTARDQLEQIDEGSTPPPPPPPTEE
jgi:uncharacterized Zn finger protein